MLNGKIDLRSDTITQPDAAMREAMASAIVGDDVLGDDPTVQELEQRTAALLGKEAAVFVPSGTMANQLAIRSLTRPGEAILLDANAHIYCYEAGAPAVEQAHLHPGQCRRRAGLVTVNVRIGVEQDRVAGPRERADRQLVGHRSGRHEQRRLLAEQFRRAAFQFLHGQVIAQHIVADDGTCHGLAHGGVGLGDCVATQIDFAVEHGRTSILAWPGGGNAFGMDQAARKGLRAASLVVRFAGRKASHG